MHAAHHARQRVRQAAPAHQRAVAQIRCRAAARRQIRAADQVADGVVGIGGGDDARTRGIHRGAGQPVERVVAEALRQALVGILAREHVAQAVIAVAQVQDAVARPGADLRKPPVVGLVALRGDHVVAEALLQQVSGRIQAVGAPVQGVAGVLAHFLQIAARGIDLFHREPRGEAARGHAPVRVIAQRLGVGGVDGGADLTHPPQAVVFGVDIDRRRAAAAVKAFGLAADGVSALPKRRDGYGRPAMNRSRAPAILGTVKGFP